METTHLGRVLEDLIETLEDGKKGFGNTAEKLTESGRADLASRMTELSSQRGDFAVELANLATKHGIQIDEDGSLGGAMHRGWMNLKEALASDESHAVLAAAEAGEDHAVSEYEKALDEELPEDVLAVVSRQASAVKAAHDEVRALRDSQA